MREWHERYEPQGLVVIGNHYPEFKHEEDLDNLKEAIVRLDVPYPVAQDNEGVTWRAYRNRYWPTLYLIDKQGIIRYVDVHDIDEQPDNDELFQVLAEVEPEAATAAKLVLKTPVEPEPEADVVLYCTTWCPACRRARLYLEKHGIDYVEINITRDRAAAKRVRNWTGGYETTPTFNIKGNVIVNFVKAKVDQALGIG